jgi:hypothetical protein
LLPRWIALCLGLFLAPCALADHRPEPIAVGSGTPISGGVMVLDPAGQVRGDGDRARIVLEADGYRFESERWIVNTGKAVKVELAVPLAGLAHDVYCGEGEQPPECGYPAYHPALARVPEDLHLFFGGARVACRLMLPPGPRWMGEPPPRLLPWKPAGPLPPGEGWCLAEVTVPARARLPLRLTYSASFAFVDEWDGDGTTSRPRRTLRLRPSPGSINTEGYDGTSTIEIDSGRFEGLVTVAQPSQVTWSGRIGKWRSEPGRDPGDGTVTLTLDVAPVLRTEELLACHGMPWGLEVRASSTLASQAGRDYAAKNVFDGDPATAWCEGASGPGVGAWLELSYERTAISPSGPGEPFVGYVLVPGYARTQQTWSSNRRLLAIRLAPCDHPEEGEVIRLDAAGPLHLPERFNRAALLLPPLHDDPFAAVAAGEAQRACVRLTIVEVTGGTYPDACVSEFRPVLRCRPEPPLQ